MNRKGNVVTTVLTVLILISLAIAGGGFYLFQKEHKKNVDLQSQLDDINSRLKSTQSDLDESKRMIVDLQLKRQEDQLKIDNLSRDLDQEKAGRQEALSKIQQMQADLDEQKASRADLENKLNQAQEDGRKTMEQLAQLQSQKSELETKISYLEAKTRDIELGKIVVSTPTEGAPAMNKAELAKAKKEQAAKAKAEKKQKALLAKKTQQQPKPKPQQQAPVVSQSEGKVLVVNKEYNFAVISLGSRDGVAVGKVFSVYHNGAYIGDMRVEKVHDAMSAAGFTTLDKNKISEGDKVSSKG